MENVNELWGTGSILGGLAGLMLGVRMLQRTGRIGPEIARKTVHVGMGVISFALPWVYPSPRPIWFVAGAVVLFFIAVRCWPALSAHVGGVLGSVSRASLGEIYYPIGAALAFTVAHGTPLVFCGAMAVLTFGDTAGAVVGTRWGRRHYAMPGGAKTIEGSLAVLVVSSACVSVALLLSDRESWPAALVGGGLVGLIAALIEAVACRGLDNLFLPIAVVGLINGWIGRAENVGLFAAYAAGAALLFLVAAIAANCSIRWPGKKPPPNPAGR